MLVHKVPTGEDEARKSIWAATVYSSAVEYLYFLSITVADPLHFSLYIFKQYRFLLDLLFSSDKRGGEWITERVSLCHAASCLEGTAKSQELAGRTIVTTNCLYVCPTLLQNALCFLRQEENYERSCVCKLDKNAAQ